MDVGPGERARRRFVRLLETWVALVQRRPGTTLVVCAVVAACSLVYTACGLKFKTDRTDLINPASRQYRNWKRFEHEFGGESDIVAIVEGSDRREMIAAIETLARDIQGYPQHFEKLCYRIRTEKLRAKGLYQLPLADIRRIHERIDALKPLLLGGWRWLTIENVLRATRFRVKSLSLDGPLDPASHQTLASTAAMLESFAHYVQDGRLYQSPWRNLISDQRDGRLEQIPEYFFSANGRLAFLRVAPVRQKGNFNGGAEAVALLRQSLQKLQAAFPALSFGLTGLPVLEVDEMQASQQASTVSFGLSVAGVGILFVAFFRALRHPLYVIAALLIGASWTMGWVTLTVGHLTVLSVSFIVTLIGLGIDFGIVWLSRFETERGTGQSPYRANLRTARSVGPGIVVGAVTTTLAFFATMLTGFLGLQEMGWIAGCGILLCVLAAITVLPAALALPGCRAVRVRVAVRDARPAFPWVCQHPVAAVAIVGTIAAVLTLNAPRLTTDYNLLNLQRRGLASVEWEKRLVEETGTSAWYALSIADSAEAARALRQRFESLGSVGRVVEIASLIPQEQGEKEPMIRAIHDSVQQLPPKGKSPELPEPRPQTLLDQLTEMSGITVATDASNRVLIERLATAADRARRALTELSTVQQVRRIANFENLWIEDLLDRLYQLRDVADHEPVGVADLPPCLAERYHSANGHWLVQIFARSSVWDLEPLRQFCTDVDSVDPNATGKPISTLHALLQMHEGNRRSASIALVLVLLAVWIDLRNVLHAALAVAPLLLGCGAMFGTMALGGVAINPANIIALPLILGIGVDAGVHVLHDYREARRPYVLNWRLARALVLNGLTTVVGFASLMTARHWGMFSIGLVLAIGVSAVTLVAVTFLPALLHLLDRRRASLPLPLAQPSRGVASEAA